MAVKRVRALILVWLCLCLVFAAVPGCAEDGMPAREGMAYIFQAGSTITGKSAFPRYLSDFQSQWKRLEPKSTWSEPEETGILRCVRTSREGTGVALLYVEETQHVLAVSVYRTFTVEKSRTARTGLMATARQMTEAVIRLEHEDGAAQVRQQRSATNEALRTLLAPLTDADSLVEAIFSGLRTEAVLGGHHAVCELVYDPDAMTLTASIVVAPEGPVMQASAEGQVSDTL